MQNLSLFKVFMAKECGVRVSETLLSGFIGQGKKVDQFEEELQKLFLSPYVSTTNSATSAIHLALTLIKEFSNEERKKVLSIPITCTATNIPIIHNNLDIRWADTDPATCNVDLDDLHKKIDKKTLAVIIVHWAGYPVDMDKLHEILDFHEKKNNFRPFLIEDCAHAVTMRSQPLLKNNFAVYSFGPIKHLTTGDGGALVCPDNYFHQKAKLLRWYGLDRTSKSDFRCSQLIQEAGYKFHMNDINATIGLENIKEINSIVKKHQANADWLRNNLKTVTHLEHKRMSADWILTVYVKNREEFVKMMSSHGIETSRVHDRNDKHPIFSQYKEELSGTTKACESMICLPCGWWLDQNDLERIASTVNKGDWICSDMNLT